MTTRRRFLGWAGASVVGSLAGAACRPGALFDPPGLAPGSGPFAVPSEPAVDLVGHVLSRCAFGVRPGDRERVTELGGTAREAVAAWLEQQVSPQAVDDRAVEHRLRAFESLSQSAGDVYEYRKRVVLEDLTRATLLRTVFSRRRPVDQGAVGLDPPVGDDHDIGLGELLVYRTRSWEPRSAAA